MALKANWTLDQIINQLDSGTKWNVTPGGTITWGTPSIRTYYKDESWYFDNSEIYGLQRLNAAQTAIAARSLSLWSDVANINFVRVADNQPANITFQNSTNMGDAYAWAYYPTDANRSMKGSIWFNSSTSYEYSSELQNPSLTEIYAGGWSYMAFVHEIGHALGLEHMGDYDASQGGPITYQTHASCVQDSMLYSVMSYFTPWQSKQADWQASDGKFYVCQTPMMNDIAAIQKIYGVNTTTRVTDTVYGFNASAGLDSVYNFNINQHPVLCLFDSGGIDTLDLSGFATNSNVNLLDGAFSSCDMMTNNISIARNVIIENASTGTGNDTISGNAANNIVISNAGNDILNGLAGHDQLFGGAGDDIYFVDSIRDLVVEATGGGMDTVRSTISVTLAQHVENAILDANSGAINATGNAGINQLTGNDSANVLNGGAGNDVLYAGAGNDTLNGGTGADQLFGGDGHDLYEIDNAGDRLIENNGEGTDRVLSSVTVTTTMIGEHVENIQLTGSAAISATGNASANTITGNANANTLNGESGSDTLNGGAGHDRLFGGADSDMLYGETGNDLLDGGAGADQLFGGTGNDLYVFDHENDVAFELAGQGTDTVQSFRDITLGANIENITLLGTAEKATGNELANLITGNAGANMLNGGAGLDTLVGGAGADIFVFSTALSTANVDTIRDFNATDDTIHLDDAIFGALTLGDLNVSAFSISTRALDADDRILYNARTGALSYDADGNGAQFAAIQFATLSRGLALTAADFVII